MDQLLGRCLVLSIFTQMLLKKLREHRYFIMARLSSDGRYESKIQALSNGCAAMLDDSRREGAGGFDIRGIVEQHQCLLRNVRPIPLAHGFLARGRIKRDQARMKEAPLPPRVEA